MGKPSEKNRCGQLQEARYQQNLDMNRAQQTHRRKKGSLEEVTGSLIFKVELHYGRICHLSPLLTVYLLTMMLLRR